MSRAQLLVLLAGLTAVAVVGRAETLVVHAPGDWLLIRSEQLIAGDRLVAGASDFVITRQPESNHRDRRVSGHGAQADILIRRTAVDIIIKIQVQKSN